MNVVLIMNNGARSLDNGDPHRTAAAVAAEFRARGNVKIVTAICPAAALPACIQENLATGPDLILVGGGDGTTSTAAEALAGTDIPLGVVPLGTLNHFARDLGLPMDWREAARGLANGVTRTVDMGEVNGRLFVNNCSLGSYAEAVRKREALRRRRGTGKWLAMLLATVVVFRRLRRIRIRIETPDRTLPRRTPFVVVANNRYSGHVLDRSLRSQLDGGKLWIYTTQAARHGAILRFLWQSLTREIDAVDALEQFEVTSATIQHDYPSLPVALDGELVELKAPYIFRIRPRALRVVVPARTATGLPRTEAAFRS